MDSVRRTLGEDVASRCKPIWGMDEEGELNSAWRDCGVPNLWIMVGESFKGASLGESLC